MPGKVKVKIIAGRNLPVMDRSSDTTDAYVEIKLGNTTYKTDVCRKSLNPLWNSEWYRFEVDDSELQDEPLQIRLMDHDTYSANDAIGKVYLNLNPLLMPAVALPGKYGWGNDTNADQPSSSVMSGWIPVYDTMHGIRGEVNVTVKVELFSDFNKFRQSSCGVQFFCSPVIPHGYHAQVIHGFIEELVVNDDPEYQWIDKIRTPRASNEARQTLFFKLSGELQRKIGVKALDLGGNAVIGYNQCFDLEGESGIVARGIGTVVTLIKHHEMQQQLDIGIAEEKALSYLKFLAFDNGLKLENDNIFERFTLSSPLPNTSIFVSTLGNPKEQLPQTSLRKNIPIFLRQTSQPLIEYEPLPPNLKTSLSSRSLSDDIKEEIALRQLLRHEEAKEGSSIGLSRKIKHLKQNMLYKKMNALKTKLGEPVMQESLNLDTASVSSRAENSALRTSLIDLRELRKKKKQNNPSYMAELLVRSVMHVHTSLDCIVECHDSGSGPPHSTSTSVSTEEIEDTNINVHKTNESPNTVLDVTSGGYINKTISEPYLLLPDNTIVTPSSNASSDSASELSSSDGSDSPSEIKDDKLDFDTISLIVKNVQNEDILENGNNQELHFSYLNSMETDIQPNELNNTQNTVLDVVPESIKNNNFLFVTPVDLEKKIEQFRHSAMFNTSFKSEPRKRSQLDRTLSRSCTDIATITIKDQMENNNILTNSSANNNNIVILPVDIENKIAKLRHSALFKSIIERPQNKLSKTFSISSEEICNLTQQKMNKAFSISCEEIYSLNINETANKHENNDESISSTTICKNPVPRRKGKLQRTFSISCEDIDVQPNYKEDKIVVLPADIEKRIETLFQSPLFCDSNKLKHNRGKMNRTLSKSCADINSPDKISDNKNLLSANIDKKINMFKNSPLFKISILSDTKQNSKLNKELSLSCNDITDTINKNDTYEENMSLVNTAVHTMLTEKINLLSSRPMPISPRAREQLNFQSNPELRNDSLIKTAVQTILMEKIDLMSTQQAPVSKRVKEEFQKNIANSTSKSDPDISRYNLIKSAVDRLHFIPKISPSFLRKSNENHSFIKSNPDLTDHNSVKNVIMDKIHLLTSKSPSLSRKINILKNDDEKIVQEPLINLELNNDSLTKTAMQTILMEKVNILTPSISPEDDKEFKFITQENVPSSPQKNERDTTSENCTALENDSLFKTAMQTMLIDKVNIIAPGTTQVSNVQEKATVQKHSNLDTIKTTVHTVLDKVHILSKSPDKKICSNDNEEPSLMKTAMQTMLIDKVNIIAPEVNPVSREDDINEIVVSPPKHNHPKLDKVKTVVHNVLDRVTNLTPISPKHGKTFDFSKEDEDPSLMKTAMQTMLIDKVNLIAPDVKPAANEAFQARELPPSKYEVRHEHLNLDTIKSTVHNVFDKVHNLSSPTKDKKFEIKEDDNNESLMKTAMQTLLMDRVNIIAPGSPSVSSVSEDFQFEQNIQDDSSNENEVTSEEYDTTKQNVVKQTEAATTTDTTQTKILSNVAANSKNEAIKKHSFLYNIKKKCKSFKPFSKFMHKNSQRHNNKEEGLVNSAVTTILMDKVHNIQGIIDSPEQSKQQSFPSPVDFPSKAYNTEKISDITLTSTSKEEPNITIKPDTGDSFNRSTAVTADDANCNTNAEHAPCLYTSDRRIVESPVPAPERERERERDREIVRESRERHGHQRTESTGGKLSQSPARLNAIPCIHRRSSDSDLSITPKGNSLTGSDRSGGTIPGYHHIRSTLLRPTVDNFDMMEYPFLTMAKYPSGFILHLGGAVSARSVKLLERITNIEEPETRDTWWSELRMEIRTHARALNCNAVLGYTETTSICDEVCVLSASGTAAVIALYSGEVNDGVSGLPILHKPHIPNKDLMTSSLDRTDFEREKNTKHPEAATTNNIKIPQVTESPEHEATIEFSGSTASNTQTQSPSCRICHIPYSESTMSFRINMLYCSVCKLAKVPDILLTTIEMPEGLPITGRGCFLQSYVCRPKRDLKGELNAKEISESLPFLEYELHRLLVNKMKVKAMNTIFGLKVRITIGEKMLIGVATGTAVFLLPLPPPPLPKLIAGNATTQDKRLAEMQKLLVDTVKKNKEIYELKDTDFVQPLKLMPEHEESDDEKTNLDLAAGNKDSCVLEVDDSEDIEVINLLVEPRPPDGFHVVNTENVPGLEELEIVRNLQMFTQVWRAKIPLNQSASHFGKHFQKLLQSVYFKLRRMIPCALCDLQFKVDLPEPDEIQLTLLGMALGLGDPMKLNKFKRKNLCHLPPKELNKKTDDELIFNLEEDHIPENSVPVISQGSLLNPQMPKHRQKSPQRFRINTKQRHTPLKERHGVDITPLSYVPGGKIERYLGYLNFFFIRETTSIREGGGLSGFVHSFITEVLAIVRAHVTALGGNAMVAYFMTECILYHNAHKNQGQCLINVGGDVVFVSYFTEDN